MNEITASSPDKTPTMTVTQMQQQMAATADRLAAASAKARQIEQWCQLLPALHVSQQRTGHSR